MSRWRSTISGRQIENQTPWWFQVVFVFFFQIFTVPLLGENMGKSWKMHVSFSNGWQPKKKTARSRGFLDTSPDQAD